MDQEDNPDKAGFAIVYSAFALSGFIIGFPLGLLVSWLNR